MYVSDNVTTEHVAVACVCLIEEELQERYPNTDLEVVHKVMGHGMFTIYVTPENVWPRGLEWKSLVDLCVDQLEVEEELVQELTVTDTFGGAADFEVDFW